MKYGLAIYEELYNISLFASTKKEAMYWGRRIVKLGSLGVTIFNMENYNVVARIGERG